LKCDKGKLKREIEASHCAMDICSWNTGTANIVRETYSCHYGCIHDNLQDDILGLTLAFEIEAAELSKSSTLALVIG